MTATCKTIPSRKPYGRRQPIIESPFAPISTQRWPVEEATHGSGASPAPLLSAAEIEAFIPDSEFRSGGHSKAKNKTVKKHARLVSAGPHESRGIPDARYLGIADRVLNQQENTEEDVEVLAGMAPFSDEAPSARSNARARRDARYLLHYRQD